QLASLKVGLLPVRGACPVHGNALVGAQHDVAGPKLWPHTTAGEPPASPAAPSGRPLADHDRVARSILYVGQSYSRIDVDHAVKCELVPAIDSQVAGEGNGLLLWVVSDYGRPEQFGHGIGGTSIEFNVCRVHIAFGTWHGRVHPGPVVPL